ncbi:hypothetical protein Naga_100010g79 [Nannochloropsis gaditana]|uniref:Uncharacterized protein n=1 Tax=Nannochloropsis gaditana TaxID=72520 RepID=W7TJA9_9STRA|nr:hypothetical protein Naga_100010g79 [Nannochloropsis gaditana]
MAAVGYIRKRLRVIQKNAFLDVLTKGIHTFCTLECGLNVPNESNLVQFWCARSWNKGAFENVWKRKSGRAGAVAVHCRRAGRKTVLYIRALLDRSQGGQCIA